MIRMKNSLFALLFFVFVSAAVCAQPPNPAAQTQQPKPSPQPSPAVQKPSSAGQLSPVEAKKKYDALLEKAKKREGTIDFKELRFAYFETSDYSPTAGMPNYKSLWSVLGQGNHDETVEAVESVLAKNYVDVNAHMVAYIAYRQAGNEGKAQYHRSWADGLLNSIKSNRDGTSIDTAFEVISVSEEYALFRSMGVQPIKQSLLREKDHSFDAVVVREPSGREITYFFNVDKPFSAYLRR